MGWWMQKHLIILIKNKFNFFLIESNRGMTWREQTEKECRHQATNLSQLQITSLTKERIYK